MPQISSIYARINCYINGIVLILLCLGQLLPVHAQKELPPVINEVLPNPPTLELRHNPATLVQGQSFSLNWLAIGSGVQISYVCTSAGTGYKASGTVSGLSGSLILAIFIFGRGLCNGS